MVQKKKINIAMLQMSSVIGDVQANIDKVENLVNITILVRFSIVRGNLLLVILKCICIHIMDAMRVNM